MAKYKNYDYSQSLLIPVSLEEQLMPGTLEFAIHTLVGGRMDRLSLRGKIKVNIQWLLYCMVHNIEKVANYGYLGDKNCHDLLIR